MSEKKFKGCLRAIVCFSIFSTALLAHHGTAGYDREHPITLTGVVTEYAFLNPHALIHLDVRAADGTIEKWVAEAAPPQRLFRGGWKTNSFKPGDKITLTGSPMKDGTKLIGISKVTTAEGKELGQGE